MHIVSHPMPETFSRASFHFSFPVSFSPSLHCLLSSSSSFSFSVLLFLPPVTLHFSSSAIVVSSCSRCLYVSSHCRLTLCLTSALLLSSSSSCFVFTFLFVLFSELAILQSLFNSMILAPRSVSLLLCHREYPSPIDFLL